MPNLYKLLIVLVLDVGSIIVNIASQMTLALDFPCYFRSRCQCKKLISVYLKLLYFKMVIQSMKYRMVHIHIIPREALRKNCDLFALEGQRKAFSSNSLQLCFHMLPTLLIFLPRKNSPFCPFPPLICPVKVYFWRRGLISLKKQSFLATTTQALWSYYDLTLFGNTEM